MNIVSWNGRPGKYDLLDWNHEERKMRKGITITDEELEKLRDDLNTLDLSK